MIETINGMLRNGHLSGNHHYTGITIRMVGIEEDEDALDLAYASKFNRRPDFLRRLSTSAGTGHHGSTRTGHCATNSFGASPGPRVRRAERFECPSEGPVKLVASGLLLN